LKAKFWQVSGFPTHILRHNLNHQTGGHKPSPALGEMADPQFKSSAPNAPPSSAKDTIIDRVGGFFRTLFGSNPEADLRSNLEQSLQDGGKSGAFSQSERFMLHNILQFSGKRIEDVMVPRADIVAIEATATLSELMVTFQEAGHSRLVVHDDTLDDPRGMIHIKDLQAWLTRRVKKRRIKPGENDSTSKTNSRSAIKARVWEFFPSDFRRTISNSRMIRDIIYVPPSMRAVDLLLKMQSTRIHMAVVVDEYGGTDGLVTIEDLVEEIVGDIEDEHDIDEGPLVRDAGDKTYVIDARAPVSEVEVTLGLSLMPEDDDDEEYDTIGGLIVSMVGRVPGRREIIKHPAGIEFEVIDGDPRRVKRLQVRLGTGEADKTGETGKDGEADKPGKSGNARPTPSPAVGKPDPNS